jgi:2,4-dienoyl-CoA reductase-like NADH-dependent reductase (Old Yellow Enzyme family)
MKKGGSPLNKIFQPFPIGGLVLRNRFVRSATYDGSAERNGCVSAEQLKICSDLASGGVGLIITGITYVHPSGRISGFQNSLAKDDCIPSFRELTSKVHNFGAKIAAQLFHAGIERVKFIKSKDQSALSPSRIEDDLLDPNSYQVMTEDHISTVVHAFGEAAVRARASGFDAVQIHAAHGYLLSQFLSPLTNRRTDSWGGSLENRLRIHLEIYRQIVASTGGDYPVMIKIGVQDGRPGGLSFEEGRQACRLLAESGYTALEISLGLRGKGYSKSEFRTQITARDREAYFRPWCKEVRPKVNVPIMIVGGLRSFSLMEEIIETGDADLISLSRPLIREPQLITEWQRDPAHKAKCVSCNKCFEALIKREPFGCIQERMD